MVEKNFNVDITDEKTNSGEYVHYIMNYTKNKIKRNNSIEQDIENAIKLEDFFNTLAGYDFNIHNGTTERKGYTQEILRQQISDLIKEKNPRLSVDKFFEKLKLKGKRKKMTGNAFEGYLDTVTKELVKAFKGEMEFSSNVGHALTALSYNISNNSSESPILYELNMNYGTKGHKSENKYNKEVINQIVLDTLIKIYKQSSKYTKESWDQWRERNGIEVKIKEDAKESQGGWNDLVSGKIDTAIVMNVTHTIDVGILDDILFLLQDATFSDKGYEKTNEIHLGQTNAFRVYMATSQEPAAALGYSKRIQRWHRLVRCMELADMGQPPHPSHETGKYFYELRYMYELTGVGQQYIMSQFANQLGTNGAKYLIFHDYEKGGGNIKVLATSVIIEDMLNAVENNMLEKHSVEEVSNKEYALNAALKLRVGKKYNGGVQYGYR